MSVNQMVGIETSAREREALRHELGLDQPAIVHAARFLMNAARLDFGVSYQFKQPVADLIGARMPATLELALAASILALAAGVPMGVYAALRRDSALARLFQALSLIGISLPTFLIGILLIYCSQSCCAGCLRSTAATWCASARGGRLGCSRPQG